MVKPSSTEAVPAGPGGRRVHPGTGAGRTVSGSPLPATVPTDAAAVSRHRRGLARTRAALDAGRLRIGFIGGSITAPDYTTWPEGVIAWFTEKFPLVHLEVENVAIGATGSDLGLFRARRDLIERRCDLVFVEYATNDGDTDRTERRRTQEGLVRALLAADGRDLVFAYTYSPPFYEDMAAGLVPPSIADLEEIAAHYGIGSVWMGLHAFEENRIGRMRWEEWLPDGLHPTERGSWSYASAVRGFLDAELLGQGSAGAVGVGALRPPPLDPENWERATTLGLADVELTGPWTLRRCRYWWADQLLETAAVGARLAFDFTGRELCLGFDFGKASAEFRYRIDGGEWVQAVRDRPDWCGESGWFRLFRVPGELPSGPHRMELEVVHGGRPDCTGTNFRLALIGVVP